MKVSCDVIKDLLALYAEDMVTQDTKNLVEEHCMTCAQCKITLDEMKTVQHIPIDNDASAMVRIKTGIYKRRRITVISAILIAVTFAAAVLVWLTSPIWLSAEDAIEYVEQMNDGQLKIKYSDQCSGRYLGEGVILCYMTRDDILFDKELPAGMNDASYGGYDVIYPGESLWYVGSFAGEETTLLWGDERVRPNIGDRLTPDRSQEYIFYVSLTVGALLMLLGFLFCKTRVGKICFHCATPFLCCSLSVLVVTWGNFLAFEDLPCKLGCTLLLTVLNWSSVLCFWKMLAYHRADKA